MKRGSLFIVVAVLVAGCSGGVSGAQGRSPSATAAPSGAGVTEALDAASTTASGRPMPAALIEMPPRSCPVTTPMAGFVPPLPAPNRPPAYYHAAWYGTTALWTMLDRDGEVWAGLPRDAGGLSQKTFWWSALWNPKAEPEPAIRVDGRRLDGPGAFATMGPGTNASADFGVAMLVGVSMPAAGCWELTASYRAERLSVVVWVAG